MTFEAGRHRSHSAAFAKGRLRYYLRGPPRSKKTLLALFDFPFPQLEYGATPAEGKPGRTLAWPLVTGLRQKIGVGARNGGHPSLHARFGR